MGKKPREVEKESKPESKPVVRYTLPQKRKLCTPNWTPVSLGAARKVNDTTTLKPKPTTKWTKKFDWRAAHKARQYAGVPIESSASPPKDTKWSINGGSNHRYPNSKYCGVDGRCKTKCWRNMQG